MKNIDRQKEAIAEYINIGLPLDAMDGLKLFGTMKLSTRIGELEREGKIGPIKRGWKQVETKYCNKVKVRTYQL